MHHAKHIGIEVRCSTAIIFCSKGCASIETRMSINQICQYLNVAIFSGIIERHITLLVGRKDIHSFSYKDPENTHIANVVGI